MPARRVPGNRFAHREKRFERFRVYNLRYLNLSLVMLAGTLSGDAYTFSRYEKMFGNAGFVKTTQHAVPDSPQQLLL